jgi:drug/metabolite transporter superfamily protein YnfA
MRRGSLLVIGVGFLILGSYGISINLLEIDFSRLLGAYVGVFAITSTLAGTLLFGDQVPTTTWVGLAVVLGGSLIIHLGRAG